jgi:serine/threonine-protein kinase HipA
MAELTIWMGGRRVGALDGSDRRNLGVVYDDEWIERPDATPLSVAMPLGAREHSGKQVAAYLWGLLPDNDRVLERWASAYQCSATDIFGLLKGVGADVAGAAQYLERGATPEDGMVGLLEVLTEADVAELLRTIRSDSTAWHPDARGRWSLAGAQAKIARGEWAIPSGMAPTTHILKPSIAGLDHHDLNEHLCLGAAGRLGLRVADTSIQRFLGVRALVVRRFDRSSRNGSVVRIHQEDCCQALGIHPERKYEVDGGPGLEAIAALLRDVEIVDPQPDIDGLLRAAAFNWLILGTDAHAKNYSLLLSGPQVRLAPLYDIASAAPYADHPKKLRLAQKIGGEYRPTVIGRRHWERLATDARTDPERLVAEVIRMATDLPDAVATVIGGTDLEPAEQAAGHSLLDAVATWTTACRTAMHAR